MSEQYKLKELQISTESSKRNSLMELKIKHSWKDTIPQFIICLIVHGLVIPAGVNMAYSTFLIHGLKSDHDIIKNIDDQQASFIACLVIITIPIGAVLSGLLMDIFGRKIVCILACIPSIISWVLLLTADSMTMIYSSRILAGIGAGLSSVIIVYTTEISHPRWRAVFLCFNSIFFTFGILITSCLGAFFSWYTMAIIFVVLNCLTFCCLFYIPESPVWLLNFGSYKSLHERLNKAKEILKMLNPSEIIPEEEFYRIEDTCERQFLSNPKNTTFAKVVNYLNQLLQPQSYNPIIILAVILSLQQLSGSYTIIFFSITVFKDIGENYGDKLSDAGALIILSLTRFIMSLILAHLCKVMGRKQLCLISGIGMSFSMLFSAMYLYINSAADKSQTGVLPSQKWLLLVIMLLYVCATSVGFFDIPWALIGELLPTSIRGVFCGLFVSGAHLVMFGVTKAYPYVLKIVGIQYAFVFFCVNSVIMTIYVHFYLPETKGRCLVEIEHHFVMNRKVINISGV